MILKASQRGGTKQLGLHLLKTEENEHVEVYDIRGFMADNVLGAMKEAQAVAMGTRCKQHLFSISLNPPQYADVSPEEFESALSKIEERTGLTDQPRIVVFHEKEGRRHAHAVYSRIIVDEMKAVQLSHYKNKLHEVSKELFIEHGWEMPAGMRDKRNHDPRNFTLAEWQQAKRIGHNTKDIKTAMQEAWNISDSRKAFERALEERGMFLAKGDRRGHVAVTYEGEAISIARYAGKKAKEVRERLSKPDSLRSVSETKEHIASFMMPLVEKHLREYRFKMHKKMSGLMETLEAYERDKKQNHDLRTAQMTERRGLQSEIHAMRQTHTKGQTQLYKGLGSYRRMQERQASRLTKRFNRVGRTNLKPRQGKGHEPTLKR